MRSRGRHNQRLLSMARATYADWAELLATLTMLDAATTAALRIALRVFAVQHASRDLSVWWRVYAATRLISAAIVLAVPAWVLLALAGPGIGEMLAYAMLTGVIAAGYGIQQHRIGWIHLTAATAIGGLVLAVVAAHWHWRAVELGAAAAVGAAVLVVGRLVVLMSLRDRFVRPFAMRDAGWLLPAQLASVRLLWLLDALQRARPTNHNPRYRRNFVRWMDRLIASVEWEIPATAVDLRLGDTAVADARQRVGQLRHRLSAFQMTLLNDPRMDTYDRVSRDAAGMVQDLARGDWSSLGPVQEPPAVRSWLALIARHLAAAVLLIGTAFGLPYLPGIGANSAVGSVQLGLVVAAILSLLPIEAAHRDRAVSAFTG